MKLFQILEALVPDLQPKQCKVHLATNIGRHKPIELYLNGEFDAFQDWQNRKNFQRPLVLSLVALPYRGKWLFVGMYRSNGYRHVKSPDHFEYDLELLPESEELAGRLIVEFHRSGRQSYLIAERWADSMEVSELLPAKYEIEEFPGYSSFLLTKQRLDIVVQREVPSWKAALRNVSGVYLIADRTTGTLYVGSAHGVAGMWGRWCEYSKTGHGGNRELRKLLKKKGKTHADNFQFGVLETADSEVGAEEILARESRWKDLLLTRSFGHNAN
ncbi:MAG: hypothetical protein CMJ98_01760 [Planctomycetes bacterium]|jgi:hypothetical protein|nr:hypothetical protein [Planctomycetota bacterium]